MRPNLSETANLVREHFVAHASAWKLQPDRVRADYVPSPGGFGPMNFAVHDGESAYHVKLNKRRDQLSAWVRAAQHLSARYRAPRFFAELELAGRHGAVFERLPGKTPDQTLSKSVLDEIVSMLGVFHQDCELAKVLGGAPCPARQSLLEYHIPMCEEDLKEIEGALPLPFVDSAAVEWMLGETHALRDRALRSAAFDEEVGGPIHGDLWFGNVLIEDDRWWVIDWDDLKIGDPAHDLSLILLTAMDDSAAIARWLRGRSPAFVERFEVYARAALLTFVIDPIADWVAAESFPGVRDAARAHREALHRWALVRYRKLYDR